MSGKARKISVKHGALLADVSQWLSQQTTAASATGESPGSGTECLVYGRQSQVSTVTSVDRKGAKVEKAE